MENQVYAACFSLDDTSIIVAMHSKIIIMRISDGVTTTILTKQFAAATNYICQLANYICQLASGHILTVERHGGIDILDITQNRLIKTINMLDDDITRIDAIATTISSDSTLDVVICIDIELSSVIKNFQASTNTFCCQFVHGGKITACCISHDNKLIGIGDYGCTVTLYRFDQEIKQLIQIPKDCTGHRITQLYFLPGNTDMVIHSTDRLNPDLTKCITILSRDQEIKRSIDATSNIPIY